ncbi:MULTISPECIES: TetR/AcrR family transcriptional regulator [Bacillus]|uniref:TetR/AcrR family transcriptional regulator n=1 Tax=Bacillus TaxID=1386 RepID=UPI000306DC8D|nr:MULTISPECIES: TetR/AcrR family transcriptional regulator [Bacillus]
MKDKILEACIDLFGEKGYKETSIQDITKQIGVTKGAFYYYYNSKQEILGDICMSYIETQLEQQQVVLDNPSLDSKEKLYQLVLIEIKSIKNERGSARIFFRDMRNIEDSQLKEIKVKRNQFRKNYQTLINQGINNGEFKESLDAEMLTFGILGIANWTYYWFKPDGRMSEESITDIFVDMILNGITNDN